MATTVSVDDVDDHAHDVTPEGLLKIDQLKCKDLNHSSHPRFELADPSGIM